jgi:hypothetical protein
VWASYQLDSALAPLVSAHPHMVPFAVRLEMLDGAYSRELDLVDSAERHGTRLTGQPAVTPLSADRGTWLETLLMPVMVSYTLSGAAEIELRADLDRILSELGIGDQTNPRPATHLPADLRARIFADRAAKAASA